MSSWSEFSHHEVSKVHNAPEPDECPKCKGHLFESSGFVGEAILYCPNDQCPQDLVWEDAEASIRRAI